MHEALKDYIEMRGRRREEARQARYPDVSEERSLFVAFHKPKSETEVLAHIVRTELAIERLPVFDILMLQRFGKTDANGKSTGIERLKDDILALLESESWIDRYVKSLLRTLAYLEQIQPGNHNVSRVQSKFPTFDLAEPVVLDNGEVDEMKELDKEASRHGRPDIVDDSDWTIQLIRYLGRMESIDSRLENLIVLDRPENNLGLERYSLIFKSPAFELYSKNGETEI